MREWDALQDLLDRFWAKVDRSADGCWLWNAGGLEEGYGRLRVWGTLVLAHRFSYALHYGPPPEGVLVLHNCDVPACVRPDHLFLGDHQANADDSTRKGRRASQRGERHGRAKLTAAAVADLRARRTAGTPLAVIAADLGVSVSAVSRAARGHTWQ